MDGLQIVTSPAPAVLNQYRNFRGSPILSPAFPIDGLQAQHFLGGSLDQSARQMAPKTIYGEAQVIGSPTVNNYYLGLKAGASYLDLACRDFAECTLAAVVRSTDTNEDDARRPVFIGSAGLGGTTGSTLYVANASEDRIRVYRATAVKNVDNSPQATGVNNWRLLIGTYTETTQNLYNKTDNDVASDVSAGGARLISSTTLKVGGGPGSVFNGTCDIAWCGVWNRALSAADTNAVINHLRPYYSARGITI